MKKIQKKKLTNYIYVYIIVCAIGSLRKHVFKMFYVIKDE